MKKLSKSYPPVSCTNGEHVIAVCGDMHVETCLKGSRDEDGQGELAGCGELRVEICLKDLLGQDAQGEFTKSDPVVSYCEKGQGRQGHGRQVLAGTGRWLEEAVGYLELRL